MRAGWLVAAVIAACVAWSALADAQVTGDEPEDVFGAPKTKTDMERAKAELEAKRPAAALVTQAGAVDPKTYVLGPGDVLEVDLWGRVVRAVPLPVSPEGSVFIPGRGPLDVGGRTLDWARERIQRQIADVYVGVHSDVRLVQLRTFKVYVTGFVKVPGAVEVNSATRASEAVSSVGLIKTASRRNIEVRRMNGTIERLDLDAFELAGRQERDPHLIDGDVVSVPRAGEFVYIDGAVARPGAYELANGDSLSTLLGLAGGLMPAATPERALMIRFRSPTDRDSLWVDLPGATRGEGDVRLQGGDRVFVQYRPEYHRQPTVEVVGEIERPGTYPIVPGRDRLSDLVGWAGGFRPDANRSSLYLSRGTEKTDQKEGPTGTEVPERDADFDRLVRLSRNQMTDSEYAKLETMLAERRNGFRVDWNRLQEGRTDIDPLLQENDVLRVDRLVPSVRVEGQVKRPGYVDYAPGRTVGEYVRLAGGFTERSARSSVRVSRGFTGQIVPARSLRVVQPGDFIWVPERRDVDAWGVFRDIITVAGQVAVIIFTLGR